MGADGVQMGTRFVTTYECDASEEYKQAYLNAGKEEVVLVDSPVGMIGRTLKNTFVQNSEKRKNIEKCYQCVKTCNPATTPYCITQALVKAAKGEIDDALVFCGENVWKCEKMEHVEDIIRKRSCLKRQLLLTFIKRLNLEGIKHIMDIQNDIKEL